MFKTVLAKMKKFLFPPEALCKDCKHVIDNVYDPPQFCKCRKYKRCGSSIGRTYISPYDGKLVVVEGSPFSYQYCEFTNPNRKCRKFEPK